MAAIYADMEDALTRTCGGAGGPSKHRKPAVLKPVAKACRREWKRGTLATDARRTPTITDHLHGEYSRVKAVSKAEKKLGAVGWVDPGVAAKTAAAADAAHAASEASIVASLAKMMAFSSERATNEAARAEKVAKAWSEKHMHAIHDARKAAFAAYGPEPDYDIGHHMWDDYDWDEDGWYAAAYAAAAKADEI